MATTDWIYTDDASAPCALCVQWIDPDEEAHLAAQDFGSDGMGLEYVRPFLPIRIEAGPGVEGGWAMTPVEHLYSGIHDKCQQSVDLMHAEQAHEAGRGPDPYAQFREEFHHIEVLDDGSRP